MNAENRDSLLETLIRKLKPTDLVSREHRQVLTIRIEQLMEQTGMTRRQFSDRMRLEMNSVRTWMSSTCDLTVESMKDICGLLGITLSDLLLE